MRATDMQKLENDIVPPDGGTACDPTRSRWIPWAFVAFFAVIFAVNGVMVAFAFGSWTGLATDDAYGRGLRYAENIAAARAQEALGWTADFRTAPAASGAIRLMLDLNGADGRPVGGADVTATLWRPTHAGYDRTITLTPRGGGLHEAVAEPPLPGLWEIRVVAVQGEHRFRLDRRVTVDRAETDRFAKVPAAADPAAGQAMPR